MRNRRRNLQPSTSAIPAAPVLSLGAYTDTTQVLTSTSPAGATGYKWFNGGVQFGGTTGSPTVTITGLTTDTTYNYTCKATNGAGDSVASNTVTKKTAKVITQTITATGTWRAADIAGFVGTNLNFIRCTGAGGLGQDSLGNGGGGGAFAQKNNLTIVPATTYNVFVPLTADDGGCYWDSGLIVVATSGTAGIDGGGGATTSGCAGDVVYGGGNGAPGNGIDVAGGGGASAGPNGPGTDAITGAGATGGTSQASGGDGHVGSDGGNGGVPGGGGGAGLINGGAGGRGEIVLRYLTD